jgi:hypothetical protein
LFIAENVVKVREEENLDISEEIEVILVPTDSVFEKITTGTISVAGTVAPLFLGLNLSSLIGSIKTIYSSFKKKYYRKIIMA